MGGGNLVFSFAFRVSTVCGRLTLARLGVAPIGDIDPSSDSGPANGRLLSTHSAAKAGQASQFELGSWRQLYRKATQHTA